MDFGKYLRNHEKHRGGRWARTGPKKAWAGRPMPTGLGGFGPGSASLLTYTLLGSFISPASDGRHIHSSELGET